MEDKSQLKMNYPEGVEFMKSISIKGQTPVRHFIYDQYIITYPGYKKDGDYRLSYRDNNQAPKHTDVIDIIVANCTTGNRNQIVADLENIYTNGLRAQTQIIPDTIKNKIYWITLQEEINYPQPRFKGIKLPFQRFFEATLVCLGLIDIQTLYTRTNNHNGRVPSLLSTDGIHCPIFYQD